MLFLRFFRDLLVVINVQVARFCLQAYQPNRTDLSVRRYFRDFPNDDFVVSNRLRRLACVLLMFVAGFFHLHVVLRVVVPFTRTRAALRNVRRVFVTVRIVDASVRGRMQVRPSLLRFCGRQVSFDFVFSNACFLRFKFGKNDTFLVRFCTIRDCVVGFASFLYGTTNFVFFNDRPFGRSARLLAIIFNRRVR